jgi:HEAT repeat protein
MFDTMPVPTRPPVDLIAALRSMAKDDDVSIRHAAVETAASLPGDLPTELLLAALRDPEAVVRLTAVNALGDRTDPRIGTAIAALVDSTPFSSLRAAAVRALARHPTPGLISTLRAIVAGRPDSLDPDEALYDVGWEIWQDLRAAAITTLAAWKVEDSVPDMVTALEAPNGGDLAATVTAALANLGAPGRAALVHLSHGSDRQRLPSVIAALGRIDHPECIVRLVALTRARPVSIRIDALTALAEICPDHPRIAVLYDDPSTEVRAAALARGPLEEGQALSRLLDESRPTVRRVLLRRFAIGGPLPARGATTLALSTHAHDPDGETAAAAIDALVARAHVDDLSLLRTIAIDPAAPENARWAAVRGLGKRCEIAGCIETLAVLAADPIRSIRLGSVAALGRCARHRPVAAQALLSIAFPDGAPTAQAGCRPGVASSSDTRLLAIGLLGGTRDPAIALDLASVLINPANDLPLRRAAADALTHHAECSHLPLPSTIVRTLLDAATTDDTDLRRATCRALAFLPPVPSMATWFQSIMNDADSEVRRIALRAIVPALPSESRIEICTQALQDPADTVAGTAAAFMLETDDASCAAPIIAWLLRNSDNDTADLRPILLARLSPAMTQAAREKLLDILRDPDHRVVWPTALRLLATCPGSPLDEPAR